MTPNPDEELEAEIDEVLVDVTNVCNDCEHPRCLAQLKSGRKHIMELIKSREERLVREARIDELEKLPRLTLDSPNEHKSQKYRDYGMFITRIYLPKRLATLKEGE